MYLGDVYTYEYKYVENWDYSGYPRKLQLLNERLVKVKKSCFKKIWAHNYPKDNYLTCSPKLHFSGNSGKQAPYYYEMFKTIPKLIIKIGEVDLSNIDIMEQLHIIAENYHNENKKNLNDPMYLDVQHLCAGTESPILHAKLKKFNLPVTSK